MWPTPSDQEKLLGSHNRVAECIRIVQAASEEEKRRVYEFLKDYFGDA
jgi:predicted RNA-binding protein YlqC (UPF0109 family)